MIEILIAVLKTGGGALFTLLLGIVTTKLFAVNLGPEGVGLYSLLRQVRDTLISITTFNSGTALVQGLSSRKEEERSEYSAVVIVIMGGCCLAIALLVFIFAQQITSLILLQSDPRIVTAVRWLSVALLFGTGLFYFGGILNGYRAIGRLAIIQVVVSLISLILAYPVIITVQSGNSSAFVVMMASASLFGMLLSIEFLRRQKWLPNIRTLQTVIANRKLRIIGSSFLSFALTTLITGFAYTGSNLIIRSMIVQRFNLKEAGIFDVSWTLSMMYMTIALNSLGTYYLPTLAQFQENSDRIRLIKQILRFTMALIVPLITGVIVLKPLVIHLLYSDQFLTALINIRWMLIGDYLKATSWIFGVTILAVADKKTLLFTELSWQFFFLLFSVLSLTLSNSVEGVGIGFALTYALYLVYVYNYAHNRFHLSLEKDLIFKWSVGLLILLGASSANWSRTEVSWPIASLWVCIGVAYAVFSLSKTERQSLKDRLKRIAKA